MVSYCASTRQKSSFIIGTTTQRRLVLIILNLLRHYNWLIDHSIPLFAKLLKRFRWYSLALPEKATLVGVLVEGLVDAPHVPQGRAMNNGLLLLAVAAGLQHVLVVR